MGYVSGRPRSTVLVLDNARIHHSPTFQPCLQHWKAPDVHLFPLPTDSPHLNQSETLWRSKVNAE